MRVCARWSGTRAARHSHRILCQVWNFRSKPVSRSCKAIRLVPSAAHADVCGGVRKRKAAGTGPTAPPTAATDDALEAEEAEDSIFTDAVKRTKILGGISVSARIDDGAAGFGGWGGGGMNASLVGPKWAQLPLGALTSPAPTPALAASFTKTAFDPVAQVPPFVPSLFMRTELVLF
jgi:hypothetical protein